MSAIFSVIYIKEKYLKYIVRHNSLGKFYTIYILPIRLKTDVFRIMLNKKVLYHLFYR